MKISIVVPAYNKAAGISFFLDRLRELLISISNEYEVIIVDDGSIDGTGLILDGYKWNELRIVHLVSNSGHMAALEAGLLASDGDVIITMDSDLQHPVDCIPRMVELYQESKCDVVIGIRERGKEESFLRRKSSELFYRILSLISDVRIEKNAGDFRLMSRMVVDTLLSLPESQKVFRFLVTSMGFRIEKITFMAPERRYGKSKYRAKNLIKLALTSLIGFSTAPLTAIFIGGLLIFALSVFYLIFLFVHFLNGGTQPGWTSIVALVVSLSSLQIISIGIVGRYVSQILLEIRNRPRFIVREVRDGGKCEQE